MQALPHTRSMIHIDGARLEADATQQGNAMVARNLSCVRDELILLRQEGLQLHVECVREELAEEQLDEEKALLDFLLAEDRFLAIPLSEFRGKVERLSSLIDSVDPHRKTSASRRWDRTLAHILARRQQADHASEAKRESATGDEAAAAASAPPELRALQARVEAHLEAGMAYQTEFVSFVPQTLHLDEATKRAMFTLERVKLLETLADISFSYVPEGTYGVGLRRDEPVEEGEGEGGGGRGSAPEKLCSVARGEAETFATRFREQRLSGFFISTNPVSAKELMRLSSAVLHFPKLNACLGGIGSIAEVAERNTVRTPAEAAEAQSSFGMMEHTYTSVPKECSDGFAEFTYFRAKNIAESLGCTLPSWSQWEAGARGSEQLLYPWGNATDPEEMYLRRGKVVSFGRYSKMTSPFGLENLCRPGCEWAGIPDAADFGESIRKVYDDKDGPPPTHCLRGLCDFVGPDSDDLTGTANRVFSGPSLATYGKPNRGVRKAAFRVCMSLEVLPFVPPTHDTVDIVLPLLGAEQWACLSQLGRIEERISIAPDETIMCYYSLGVALHATEGAVRKVTLHSGPTQDRDFAPCPYILDTSVDEHVTMSTLTQTSPIPGNLTRSCTAVLETVPPDINDTTQVPCLMLTLTARR